MSSLRQYRDKLRVHRNLKLTISFVAVILLAYLYFYLLLNVNVVPSCKILKWFLEASILAIALINSLDAIRFIVKRVRLGKFEYFVLLGCGLAVLFFWLPTLFFIASGSECKEKLIETLNYRAYNKSIYVYGTTCCFRERDCSLEYSLRLQKGWLPTTNQIARLSDRYTNSDESRKVKNLSDKAIYDIYLNKIQEKGGIVKFPFWQGTREGVWMYNLKTGEVSEELSQ
ncbi:MAG TPA: hypothetical protein V6C91_04875 [Coleofasciculaceae cyanobacterium]